MIEQEPLVKRPEVFKSFNGYMKPAILKAIAEWPSALVLCTHLAIADTKYLPSQPVYLSTVEEQATCTFDLIVIRNDF